MTMKTAAGMHARQMTAADPLHEDADADVAPSSGAGIDGGVLFESLVCDLHWSMLHVGALALATTACARMRGVRTLRPWRHFLHANASAAILTLRYAPEIGLGAALASRLTAFEEALAALQARTLPLAGSRSASAAQTPGLASIASGWRDQAHHGAEHLQALDADVRSRLSVLYVDDSRMLAAFLRDASRGDLQRVSADGEITLPTLKQRRRNVRAAVDQACRIWIDGEAHPASIANLSAEGLGITCRCALQPGQAVEIEIGLRSLAARVAWMDGANFGLKLTSPLRRDDPLMSKDFGRIRLD